MRACVCGGRRERERGERWGGGVVGGGGWWWLLVGGGVGVWRCVSVLGEEVRGGEAVCVWVGEGGVAFLLLLSVWLFFPRLLLGGAARYPPSLGGVVVSPSLVRWCCSLISSFFVPSLGGCCVSPILLRGAAWFPPSFWVMLLFSLFFLVGLSCFSSFGWAALFPSSVGWCCLVSSFLLGGGVGVFPFPFVWCCLPSPPLGVAAFSISEIGWCCLVSSFLGVVFLSFYVVLLGFFPLWVVLLFSLSCLVVLPSIPSIGQWCVFPCLLLGGAAWSPEEERRQKVRESLERLAALHGSSSSSAGKRNKRRKTPSSNPVTHAHPTTHEGSNGHTAVVTEARVWWCAFAYSGGSPCQWLDSLEAVLRRERQLWAWDGCHGAGDGPPPQCSTSDVKSPGEARRPTGTEATSPGDAAGASA